MAHNRLSNYRTTWTETNGRGSVVYVHTPIVEWNEDTITLKSGGWESVTTKRKMNQSALQFGLGFGVEKELTRCQVKVDHGLKQKPEIKTMRG